MLSQPGGEGIQRSSERQEASDQRARGKPMTSNFWLVILLFGKVGASIGPLPGDMKQCQVQLTELSQSFDQRFEADAFADAKPPMLDGRQIKRADFTFECREAPDPPAREIQLK